MLKAITRQPAVMEPIAGPIVQRVVLVDRVTRRKPERFRSSSLPGHLLHFVIEGEVRQTSGGRTQHLSRGDVVWYFEDESIRGEIVQAPWTFYTVNFEAPTLAPPPEHKRIQHGEMALAGTFESMFDIWHDQSSPHLVRHIRSHILLLELLLELLGAQATGLRSDAPTKSWWAIEAKLRGLLDQTIDMHFLEKLSGLSRRKIIETCRAATQSSPMKRLKELRLTYARGLVQHSQLTISEIAYRTGYSRVQELSRDYHERFRVTPRQERSNRPTYRNIERP